MKNNDNQTPYMQSLKTRILETAMKEFVEKGVKVVRMDDIAKSLGISKRTLYQIYDGKEELLYEGLKQYKIRRREKVEEEMKTSDTVMDIILYVYRLNVEEFRQISSDFLTEITHYPSVQVLFSEDREQSHERFIGFLRRGVDEGMFKDDVDLELISVMFSAIGAYITSNKLYLTYEMNKLFKDLIFVSLRGFCTQEGLKHLERIEKEM
ncbi:MAG: TetR/AcrR family transcriptional regulator [Prevotella sp.]|nr:TetR/AcrR family transcriptional regulator [Prevotella sp.]